MRRMAHRAAAAALAVGIGATLTALVACRAGDEKSTSHLDPADARFLPETPPGYRLCSAVAGRGLPVVTSGQGSRDNWAVWGDASLERPWQGPLALLFEHPDDPDSRHAGATPVRVGDLPAEVAPMPLVEGVSSAEWGHIVTWRPLPGRLFEVAVRGRAEEARRMAERVVVGPEGPELPRDALGPNTFPLRTSADGTQLTPVLTLAADWVARYGEVAPPARGRGREILVFGQASTKRAIELAEFMSLESRPLNVGEWRGISYAPFERGRGLNSVLLERDGHLLGITGLGITPAQVRAVLDDLTPVGDRAWGGLVTDPTACEPRGLPTPLRP